MTLLMQCQSQNGTVGYVSCCIFKSANWSFKNYCIWQHLHLNSSQYLSLWSFNVILSLGKLPRDIWCLNMNAMQRILVALYFAEKIMTVRECKLVSWIINDSLNGENSWWRFNLHLALNMKSSKDLSSGVCTAFIKVITQELLFLCACQHRLWAIKTSCL